MALRWGIVSAGKISHDFVNAVSVLPTTDHVVVAVAARKLESAEEFAKVHDIATSYGSYEDLAKDKNVDVVYIGAIHPEHLRIGKIMLENGKPILCEKPLTMNLKQTKELLDLAKAKNLFAMEAIWSRCFPIYAELKNQIDVGAVGDVQQVIVNFGVPIENVDRIKMKELGGGSILDIGVYCIQFAVLVMGTEMPTVKAVGTTNSEGVDLSMGAVLQYKNGKTVVMSTHTRCTLPNQALVVGSKGTVTLEAPFWCPTKISTPTTKSQEFALPEFDANKKKFNYGNSVGLCFEAEEVRRCLKLGLIESPRVTHQESLVIAEIEDELRRQIGVVYPQDG